MAYNDFKTESPENYEQKCLCVLVLDVSGSMRNEPIRELNQGLQEFYQDIHKNSTTKNRLEVAIVTFGSNVKVIETPALVDNFSMPSLKADGGTPMVDGIRKGINLVRERKTWYKNTGQPYYRPWIILITDGVPDNNQDVTGVSSEIENSVQNKEYFFFGIGVKGADMKVLEQLSSSMMQPAMLEGLKFSQFFRWLSASMSTIASAAGGATVDLPNTDDWTKGFTID